MYIYITHLENILCMTSVVCYHYKMIIVEVLSTKPYINSNEKTVNDIALKTVT